MGELGFTVKKNLASTIKNYLKSKGRNVSEEDIKEILQRLAEINSKRSKNESIFLGGHRYFGGNGKDFIVQKGQQINLSAKEYNEVFNGYLEKAEEQTKTEPIGVVISKELNPENTPLETKEIKLSDEELKDIKNKAFKLSLSNMSDKQLKQIANSDSLTTDIEQLKIIAQELGARGDQEGARAIAKTIKEIESQPSNNQKTVEEAAKDKPQNLQVKQNEVEQPSEVKKSSKEIKINPTADEIQSNISNLKPNESYTYLLVKEQNTWGYGKNQKNITWTRNEDMTLTKMTPEFIINGDFGALTEKYTADGKQVLSRTKLGSSYLTKGLYTTTEYLNSKPKTETTDLRDINKITIVPGDLAHSEKILGLISPEARLYKNEELKNKAINMDSQTYTAKELKNSKGETILTYKNGKFFNSKGKETDIKKARKIIEKLLEKNDLSELVKNYNI